MFGRIKRKLQFKKQETVESAVKLEKRDSFEETYDNKIEAMAFAEAGAHEMARESILQGRMEQQRILLVGREDSFSERVVDYTVSLAERLGYDIVAMNVNTVMGHSGKFLSPFRKHLREEFEKRANEAYEMLAEKLTGKDIGCQHVVKYGEFSSAVEELHHEIKRIEFVVTEPEALAEREEAEVTIPVFSMQR